MARLRFTLGGLSILLVATAIPMAGQEQARPLSQPVSTSELARARAHDKGFEGRPRLETTGGASVSVPYGAPIQPPYPDYKTFLRDQTCAAEMVLVGRSESARTMLNMSETFLFTDYRIKVEELVRGDLDKRTPVIYSQAGGTAEQAGQRMRATVEGTRDLDSRRQYVLFLRSMPGAPGFVGLPRLQVIELQGNRVLPVPRARWTPRELYFQEVRPIQLLRDIRAAAASCR